MPKNLLDDDLGEVDQLKDRYKKQEEEFLKKKRIVAFNDEIAKFSAEPKKDVKWAENYLKYFETAKIVNSDILEDVPSEKLFYKMVDDAKMIILKDKEEKEAQQKKLAEIMKTKR